MDGTTSRPHKAGRTSRQVLYQRLNQEVEDLRARFGGLPRREEAKGIWRDIWYHEAHNSTALEGNTLVLREVEVLLRDGRAVGQKQLKDYLEVQGYAAAANWVYGQGLSPGDWHPGQGVLTLTEVREIHHQIMEPVWQVAPHPDAFDTETPGSWRQHNIHPFSQGMVPPDHPEIQALMTDWVTAANQLPHQTVAIPEASAHLHARFERIHPFIDGNGRTGRLLMNLILIRLGYPPMVIDTRDRGRYLDALHRADQGDVGQLGEIFARAMLDSLMRFIIPALASPGRLVPLEALASDKVSAEALRKAASRRRLRAVKSQFGTWQSTRQWVDDYLSSRFASLRGTGGNQVKPDPILTADPTTAVAMQAARRQSSQVAPFAE